MTQNNWKKNITLFLTSQAISLFGPLADVISIRVIMGVSGAAMLALVIVVYQYKTFYEAGKKMATTQ